MDLRTMVQRASALHQAGKLGEAEQIYLSVANGKPGIGNDARAYADAVHYAGIIAGSSGRLDDGIKLIDRSLTLRPREQSYRRNLAIMLASGGRIEDAPRAYEETQRALNFAPGDVVLLQMFAQAARLVGHKLEAAEAWRRLADLVPGEATFRFNAGAMFQQAGRTDEAIDSYRRAIRQRPGYVEAMSNLVSALGARPNTEEALPLLDELARMNALSDGLKPVYAFLLARAGQIGKAQTLVEEFEQPVKVDKPSKGGTDVIRALPYLAAAMLDCGLAAEAFERYRRYCEAVPHDPLGYASLISTAQYLYPDDPPALLNLHRAYEASIALDSAPTAAPILRPLDGRRLRVGYVSGDFRAHSVAAFFEPLLVHHDVSQIEIHLFSNATGGDAVTARLKAKADRWHEVAATSDADLATLIRTAEVDVLIDLSGHTTASRLTMFALRPVPVQLTYLGYSSTTGLSAIDGLITDPVCDPPGESDSHFSEHLLRLPHTLAVFRPPPGLPEVAPAPSASKGHVTLGSVAPLRKINSAVLDAWAAGLRAASTARLMLIGAGFDDASVQQRFRDDFSKREIDPQRITFVGRLPFDQYLALHGSIDLMLDTFPFTGHTTTVQNLWMGVPVVTFAGKSHRGRMAASVLTAIGLTDLIAHDEAGYGPLIGRWASDPHGLASIRAGLRTRMTSSPLMDEVGFARDFQQLLIDAYETKRQTGRL